MGVKVTTVKNDLPSLEKDFSGLNGKKVQVGVLGGGENAWLVGIHEYGCNIPVTEKMRVWLHAHGLHLKKSTTEIHIPERSFLRSGYDAHKDEAIEKANRFISMLGKGITPDDVCQEAGDLLASKIKDYAENLSSPANRPFTIKQKGGESNPLMDTGDMVGSITYRVE